MAESKQANQGNLKRKLSIAAVELYSHVDRIYNELKQLGYDGKSSLDVMDVSKFDQYHYHGTTAVREAAQKLGINCSHHVLDIGSGLGGPSRYLAHLTGCRVTAIEMQEGLHSVATDLTLRCGLANQVKHLCGNFLEFDQGSLEEYDFIVSWLVFLHITDKQTLFSKCLLCLKPGGKMYIEDLLSSRDGPQSEEAEALYTKIYMPNLPARDQYVHVLNNVGFSEVVFEDETSDWTNFCHNRLEDYRKNKDRHIRVHNQQVYEEQEHFYDVMDQLFTRGHIIGAKVIVVK